MGLIHKFLKKSNSYNYYKNGYESLKEENKELLKKNKKLKKIQNENNKLQKFNSDLTNKINDYESLIKVVENKFKNDKSSNCEKSVKNFNIAYVLSGFPIHSETFIVSEVKWLVENGYNIIIFTRYSSYKPVNIDFDVTNIRFNSMIELETLLIEHDIDLMHTHFVYPICTNFTYPIAEKLGIPFTVFAHAYDIFVNDNKNLNNISEISKSKYCEGIFTLSDFHKNYLIDCGAKPDKIIITKQATNYEVLPLQEKSGKIKNIVSISRFVEKKGLDVLIDAAKLLENEDFEFSIYGFGDLENDLQKQIDELECQNISIKGELAPEKVKDVLLDADLLVSPCKVAKNGDMDGFPTIIFESMAVGLPILTTSVSAIPEIIKDNVNGFLIKPNDSKSLAEKIIDITNVSSDDLFKIRKSAQEDVKDISSVEKTMENYLNYW